MVTRQARRAFGGARPAGVLGTLLAIAMLGWSALSAAAAGPPYPSLSPDRSVYDPDGLLRAATVTAAQSEIDTLVSTLGIWPIVYVERSPVALSAAEAGRNADALVSQWQVSRGLVMLVDVNANGCGGIVTVRRGTDVDAQIATDSVLGSIADTTRTVLATCDADSTVLVGLSNMAATLATLSVTGPFPSGGSPAGAGALSGAGGASPGNGGPSAGTGAAAPSATPRPTATPRAAAVPAGPPFPDPVAGQYVYDQAHVFRAETVTKVQAAIQAIRERTGAEIVVYTQVVGPVVTEAQAERHAQSLMDQWGVGRKGFDDGLVILFDLDTTRIHGQVQLYAGPGYRAAFLSNSERQAIFDNDMLPRLKAADLDGALLIAMDRVDANATAAHAATLNQARIINAVIGLVGAPLALLLLIGWALLHWLRFGRDPEYIDDPSILMPAPPPDLTAAAGALVFDGHSSRHTLTTALLDLASRDELAFRPEVHRLRRDAMGIEIRNPNAADARIGLNRRRPISPAEMYALSSLSALAEPDDEGVPMVDSAQLLKFGPRVSSFDEQLELYATRKGWFRQTPRSAMNRWFAQGTIELFGGGGLVLVAYNLPSDGLLLVGGAVAIAGIVTLLIARGMPARTLAGATIRAMLAAYRRALQKTFAMSRSMDQVVASKALPWLETPDQAVVWGVALGLRKDVEDVLERTASDIRGGQAQPSVGYLPTWYGSRGWAAGSGGGLAPGLMSGSAIPNFGSMLSAIGSVGNSASSGGGYGGGGSGGGGGGAGGGF